MKLKYSPKSTDLASKMAIKELETEALKRKVKSLMSDVQKLKADSKSALNTQRQKFLEEFSLLEEDRLSAQNVIIPKLKRIKELTETKAASYVRNKEINSLVVEILHELD